MTDAIGPKTYRYLPLMVPSISDKYETDIFIKELIQSERTMQITFFVDGNNIAIHQDFAVKELLL